MAIIKLNKICRIINGNNSITKKYIDNNFGIYPVISSKTSENGIYGYINSYQFKNGITISKDGSFSGTVFWQSKPFSITIHAFKLSIIDNIDLMDKFLFYFLKQNEWKIKKLSTGSTIKGLSLFDLNNFEINIPNLKTQKNIIDIIELFEKLIFDLKKSIDIKTKIKNILLEKLFPKDSNKLPQIRFKEFNDAWEQLALNNLYSFASEGGTPNTSIKKYYENGNIPFIKIEDTNNKYIKNTNNLISKLGLDNSSAWLIKPNSIIFTNGATIGNVSINKIFATTKQGILGIIPKKDVDIEFMYYLLSNKNFKKEIAKIKNVGTFASINLLQMSKIKIWKTNFKEQTKIAYILKKIDFLINCYQSKYDKLKNIKKSLLKKMFN